MKKGIAILLVLVMSMSAIAAAFGSTDPVGTDSGMPPGEQVGLPYQPDVDSTGNEKDDPMMDYIKTLDKSRPRLPPEPWSGKPSHEAGSHRGDLLVDTDAILLFEDPMNLGEWLPLPTRNDIISGIADPLSFSNGTSLEVHGKLFDLIIDENTTYLDDIGIPSVPIEVVFDGVPGAFSGVTGNDTTVIDPFGDNGNGTFQFTIDITKPAGEYELVLHFAGWPPLDPKYDPLTYRDVIYVNHPTFVTWDVSPDTVTVGYDINVSGSLADDTGRPISSVPLQIWFDDELLGPTSDGVYIDDVQVGGTNLYEDFDDGAMNGWSTYSAAGSPSGNQWELGSPSNQVGPIIPHSGGKLWGTNLDGKYQRGAWSFLVTPDLDFTVDRAYNITFYAWWSVYWEDDLAYALASDDGGATWDEDNVMTFMGSSLSNEQWTQYEFDATGYQGSDQVRFAFVFYSADKTLDVRSDATFEFIHKVSMTAEAGIHEVTVVYEGSLLFARGEVSEEIIVKRMAAFDFISGSYDKRAYRNKVVQIHAILVDNTGAVVESNISGEPQNYSVQVYWDLTWSNDNGRGEAVGPPTTVTSDTGEIDVGYEVPWNHTLGPAKVTFVFPGSKYYTAAEQVDHYNVKAETYFLPPPVQNRTMFRGQMVDIYADHRIVIDQSIDKLEPGDPISGVLVNIYWNGQQIGNRRTDFKGEFRIDHLVPVTHELGVVNITFEYEGQSLFDPVTMSFNYSVVSETLITMEDSVVYKGTWTWMNGTIVDDKGQGIPGVKIGLNWRDGAEMLTTTATGSFYHQYYVEFEDKVGNVSVTAQFGGNSLYLKSATSVTYTYRVGTILERRDNTITVVRGDMIQFHGKLYEDWGGYRGVEVQREIVTLLIDEIVVSFKRTAFDGSVTFTASIEPDKFSYGEVDLVLSFDGTEFYHSAVNITPLVIQANSMLTFAEFRVEGELFDPSSDVVMREDETYGRVLLQDDNFQPITWDNVTVYYKNEGQRARKRLVSSGMTDSQGYFEFSWTFQVNTIGGKTFIVEYDGRTMPMSVNGEDLVILPSQVFFNFTYDVASMVPNDYEVDTSGDRLVEPGKDLSVQISIPDPGNWKMDQLVFSLVDPPEGMNITSGGTITWTPDEDDIGRHTIKIRIEDGERTEIAHVVVSVDQDGTREEATGMLLWLVGGLAVAILVVIVVIARSRGDG